MKAAITLLFGIGVLWAQSGGNRSFVGTITAMHPDTAEYDIKPDNAEAVKVGVSLDTLVQQIAPGQRDLSKATALAPTDISVGDRVLVTLPPDSSTARRIVVMSVNEIAKRDAADQLDWRRRGVNGVVAGIQGNQIALELTTLSGVDKFSVTITDQTSFKRYAADSVKYSDAIPSKLSEVKVGDQLRARGKKSEDGKTVEAETVISGTFVSRAGTITSINAAQSEVTIKDLSNNKPLIVELLQESQVKRLPDMAGINNMLGKKNDQGSPTSNSVVSNATPGAKPPDLTQVLEMLPPLKLEDLKKDEVVVISAIPGPRPDQVTAITLLANAETLVQMAMAARGAGSTAPPPSLAGLASTIGSAGP